MARLTTPVRARPPKPFAPPFDAWLDRPPPLSTHAAISGELLERSGNSLRNGGAAGRVASSEEIYGAAAHAVKTIARKRGWPRHSHDSLRRIVDYLAREAGDEVEDSQYLGSLFADLDASHRNFYNDNLTEEELRAKHRTLKTFLSLLRATDRRMPKGAPPPDNERYRAIALSYLQQYGASNPAYRNGAPAAGRPRRS